MRHIAIDQVENKPSRCHEDVLLLVERHCRVAVIGAGAAGLVAARELRKEGHEVVVFEQQEQLGGTWLYTDQVESDLLGQDAKRRRVHSSMYQGLTTNLPRQIMGYSDFPFSPSNMAGHSIDNRHFPCSEEVLRYLQAFAEHHHLQQLIRFSTHVLQAVPVRATAAAGSADVPGLHVAVPTSQQHGQQQQQPSVQDSSAALPWQRWQVTWQEHPPQATAGNCAGHIAGSDAAETPAAAAAAGVSATATPPHTELFDAVLVCNGHYTEPRLPDIPGASNFPGVLMHSHSYRCPRRFRGQHVAVIGASYSGLDIARLVAQQAAQVYVCAREWQNDKDLAAAAVRGCSNTQRRGMISRLTAAGGAEFAVGESVQQLDAVICCTGYNYHFPFLDLQALGLSTQQQHVSPLYQHMFPPAFAPGLCFIGLPWLVVPFPLFELQAKLCARLLSDRCSLPSADAMTAAVQRSFVQLQAEGLRPEHSHRLDYHQTRYHAWLAAQCGPDVSLLPNWRTAALHGFWLLRRLYLVAARIWHRPAGQPQGPKRV